MAKFIRVTLKGEKKSRILLANLKAFYQSQGAVVEEVSDEEAYAEEPAYRDKVEAVRVDSNIQAEVAYLRAENTALKSENEALRAELEALKSAQPEESKDEPKEETSKPKTKASKE